MKTEDVWLRGDSSNSKWLPFYKLGLCNKMRRGEYYQFSRPVKIAFLKPRQGWSLSREEPESVFLTTSPGGRGVWDLVQCVCACERLCVSLRETSVKASYACRPSRDRTKIYFLIPPRQERNAGVCVHVQKHTRMREILYVWKHTRLVLGAKNIRLERFWEKWCVWDKPRFSLRWLILEKDTDRWHAHTHTHT